MRLLECFSSWRKHRKRLATLRKQRRNGARENRTRSYSLADYQYSQRRRQQACKAEHGKHDYYHLGAVGPEDALYECKRCGKRTTTPWD